jgi:predicted RNase H-like HicB family nuclease
MTESSGAPGALEQVFSSRGRLYEELLENVKEAVALHFEENLDEGETLQILIL